MPRSRYRFLGNDAPYFMTLTVNHWLPVFTRSEAVDILLDSWRYLQAHGDFRLHGYVILENYLHLIAGSPQIGKDIQRFKSYTARRIIDHLEAVRPSGCWTSWRSSSGPTRPSPSTRSGRRAAIRRESRARS